MGGDVDLAEEVRWVIDAGLADGDGATALARAVLSRLDDLGYCVVTREDVIE